MAVLGHTHGFVALNALSRFDPRQNAVFLVLQFRWNQTPNGVADYFFGRITEHPLRARIPSGDDTFERFADNGVIGRCYDGRQIRLCLIRALGEILDRPKGGPAVWFRLRVWCLLHAIPYGRSASGREPVPVRIDHHQHTSSGTWWPEEPAASVGAGLVRLGAAPARLL